MAVRDMSKNCLQKNSQYHEKNATTIKKKKQNISSFVYVFILIQLLFSNQAIL